MKKLNCRKTAAPVLDEAGERGKLIEAAFHARENSYSPYSKFRVGAALLCESGEIYTGCNIKTGLMVRLTARSGLRFLKQYPKENGYLLRLP